MAAIQTAERHAHWFELRKKGLTYRQIGELEGVSHSTVQEAVIRRLRETVAEPAQELRQLELERLDALLKSVWDRAVGECEFSEEDSAEVIAAKLDAHLDSLEAARKLLADRRKLLGLDAPTKHENVTPPREEMWGRARSWFLNPSPELEQLLEECGWARSKRLPARSA